MTNFFIKSKMFRSFLIFSLCFVAIHASGEFSVFNSPKSLSFKGSDALESQYVGDVLSASLGNPVAGDAEWAAMNVEDPFNLPKRVIAVVVDGVSHISINSKAKTFPLVGSSADESLNALSSDLEASNVPVCDINFNEFEEAKINYRSCFGDVSEPAIKETTNLKPALHTGDKQFLQSLSFFNTADLTNMQKASNFVVFRLSLAPIAKAHGEKSDAMLEASKLVSNGISQLIATTQKASNNDALVVVITNKSTGIRAKRDVLPPNDKTNSYNLAEYYGEDYPVIFNIILWFMVTFGFALLAICYAIGSMDPGRDSIIYRMTSTRMKKDN